jgi:acetyl-CoA synthetase (ADP-forming)
VDIISNALREGRDRLSEYESKEVLKTYGITVTKERLVHDHESLQDAMKSIPFPLVLKGCGSDMSHKTERNLVRVDIRSEKEAGSVFDELMNDVKEVGGGILVQEMVRGRRELVAGLVRDVQFGPCVMFGLGGIFTEVLADVAFRVAPLDRADAFSLMESIKSKKILGAVRGMPEVDREALAKILINIGRIGVEQEKIKEIDINPLILDGSQPVAVDALVVLEIPPYQ